MKGYSIWAYWKELSAQGTQMLPGTRGSANSKALAQDTEQRVGSLLVKLTILSPCNHSLEPGRSGTRLFVPLFLESLTCMCETLFFLKAEYYSIALLGLILKIHYSGIVDTRVASTLWLLCLLQLCTQ